jgi:rubrerythrin
VSATPHRPRRADSSYDWAGSVICPDCGYLVDLVASDWTCWFCSAQWPKADMIMVEKWRHYLRG